MIYYYILYIIIYYILLYIIYYYILLYIIIYYILLYIIHYYLLYIIYYILYIKFIYYMLYIIFMFYILYIIYSLIYIYIERERDVYIYIIICIMYYQRKLGSNLPSYGWLLPVTIHSMKGGVRLWCETWHHITIHPCNGCMIVVVWFCHVRREMRVSHVMLQNAL